MSSGRRRLAVLGSPIAHSKSPALHAAAYGVLGLDWEYGRVELTASQLPGFLDGLDESWRGLSLTMPLKQALMPLLTGADEVARATAQANTALLTPDGVHGFNTDVTGIVGALSDAGISAVSTGLVLGGGATASSAVHALRSRGAEVTVALRSPEKPLPGGANAVAAAVVSLDDARPGDAEVTISTIPGGVGLPLGVPPLTVRHTLLDVIYDPWPTPLVAAWRTAGGSVVDGLEMLVHQALIQIRIFVAGSPQIALPDEAAVLGAMRAAVRRS